MVFRLKILKNVINLKNTKIFIYVVYNENSISKIVISKLYEKAENFVFIKIADIYYDFDTTDSIYELFSSL